MDVLIPLLALLSVLLLVGVLRQWSLLRKLETSLGEERRARERLEQRFEAQDERISQAVLDAAALRASTLGLGRQLERLEKGQGLLEAQVASAAHVSPNDSGYAQAIRMAARGTVGVDELVQDFGLPQGEAELLLRMHRQRKDEDGKGKS